MVHPAVKGLTVIRIRCPSDSLAHGSTSSYPFMSKGSNNPYLNKKISAFKNCSPFGCTYSLKLGLLHRCKYDAGIGLINRIFFWLRI